MEKRASFYAEGYLILLRDRRRISYVKGYIWPFSDVRLNRTSDPWVFPRRLSQPILLDSPQSPPILQASSATVPLYLTYLLGLHSAVQVCKELVSSVSSVLSVLRYPQPEEKRKAQPKPRGPLTVKQFGSPSPRKTRTYTTHHSPHTTYWYLL